MKQLKNFFSRYGVRLSAACFAVSLFPPAYYSGEAFKPAYGYGLLMFGWMGPLDGHFAWLANPAYLIALVAKPAKRPRVSAAASLIGLAFALSFLLHKKMMDLEMGNVFYRTIMAYGFGYWLWLAAFVVLAAVSILRELEARASAPLNNEQASGP